MACGGGGGSVSDIPAFLLPPQIDDPGFLNRGYVSSFDQYEETASRLRSQDARYTRQNRYAYAGSATTSYPLASSRTEYAHAVGLTGQGVTIAILDGGYRATHETIAGRVVATTGANSGSQGDKDHGAAVASIAAGSTSNFIGTAPEVSLVLSSWDDNIAAVNAAITHGAIAQNNSWGFTNLSLTEKTYNDALQNEFFSRYFAALDTFATSGVGVYAVSNDTASDNFMTDLPLYRTNLQGSWVAVANAQPVFTNEGISSATLISQSCGRAAPWCIVADGLWNHATAESDTSYSVGTGSSYAAPQVTAALAQLEQAFPDLSAQHHLVRLLASANNSFFTHDGQVDLIQGDGVYMHGYSEQFGHGFLDLRAALLPIGQTSTQTVRGEEVQLTELQTVTGGAVGDALMRTLSSAEIAFKDQFSGAFVAPASTFISPVSRQPLGYLSFADLRNENFISLRGSRLAHYGSGESTMAANTLLNLDIKEGVLSFIGDTDRNGAALSGLGYEHSFLLGGSASVSLGVSRYIDDGRMFGLTRAADQRGSPVDSVRLGFQRNVGSGSLIYGTSEFGMTTVSSSQLFSSDADIRYDGYEIGISSMSAFMPNDRLSIGIKLPPAIRSGSVSVAVPMRASSGEAFTYSMPVDLSPRDRQRELQIEYSFSSGDRSEYKVTAQHARNYGNMSDQNASSVGFAFRTVW